MKREREKGPSDRDERLEPDAQASPSGPPPPTLEEIDRLRRAAAERDEYLEKLQRTAAEFANYQKRVQRERTDVARYATQDFVTQILAVLDNLSLAVRAAESSHDVAKLLEGVKLVERQFEKILADNDVTEVEAEGKKFDPNLHEAILRQERSDVPEHTVVDVARRGYRLHDRVIRPAQVAIAMRKDSSSSAPSSSAPPSSSGPGSAREGRPDEDSTRER